MRSLIRSRGDNDVMSWSANVTRPAGSGSKPNRLRNSVVLPAPFGPMTPQMVRLTSAKEASFRTVCSPYPVTMPVAERMSSLISISEIQPDDGGIRKHVGGRAFAEHGPFVEEHGSVR